MNKLSTRIFNMEFKNPIWLASSDATRLENMNKAIKSGAGAIVMKSVTELENFQKPSLTRRIIFNEKDMVVNKNWDQLSSYSFFSRGGPMQQIDKVINLMPEWKAKAEDNNTKLFGSVSAGTFNGWKSLSYKLTESGIDGIELNFGNPHAKLYEKNMGLKISYNEDLAAEIVQKVKKEVGNIPIIVKVSPEAPYLNNLVTKILQSKADGITATHRFQGLRFNIDTAEPLLGGINGIGGPWMKALTIKTISDLYNDIKHPIIGGSGVAKGEDIIEMIIAGAQAVQLGTSVIINGYEIVNKYLLKMEKYLQEKDYYSYAELIGKGTIKLRDKS